MAAFNFPNSPSTNDLHTENSVTWKWNGTVWKRINNSYLTASTLDVSGIGTFGGNVDINSTLEVSGISNFDSTVKIADKIEHLSDSNTNIRFPAADTVSVETGGSERFRITSDGKIGIGEDDPDGNYLLIRAASTVGTKNGHIMLTGDSATNGQGPQIVFSESGSGSNFAGAYIGHVRTTSNSVGDLVFATRATSGDANTIPTERLRITSTGFIGVGVVTPNHMLQLHRSDSNNSYTQYTNSTTGSAIGDGVWLGLGSDEVCYLWQQENNHLILGTNNTERLRIKSDGGLLQTKTGGNANYTISRNESVTSTDQTIGVIDFASNTANTVQARVMGKTRGTSNVGGDLVVETRADGGSLDERFRITGGGNIGIGTINPGSYDPGAESLVVCGPGGNVGQSGITIVSGSDKYGCLYFGDGTGSSSYRGRVEYRHDIDVLQMGAGGAHGDFVLDAGGDMFLRGDSTCYIVLGSAGDATTGGANNSMNWIRGNGNNLMFNSATGTHNWEVGGSEKMQLEADGDLQLVSKTQCRITLGNAGSPGGNDSNWIRGDGNNIMMNCATTGGEHIFEVAGTARAKISPSKGVRAENTCKAWVCYKHDGGVSAIHDSFFVSSVTDEGTGIFGIDFEGDMGTEDAIAYQVGSHSQTPVTVGGVAYTPSYGSQNPWWSMEDDWVRINLQKVSDSGNTYTNSEWWNLIAFGDAI